MGTLVAVALHSQPVQPLCLCHWEKKLGLKLEDTHLRQFQARILRPLQDRHLSCRT